MGADAAKAGYNPLNLLSAVPESRISDSRQHGKAREVLSNITGADYR
jgi:hypothetical protein